MGPEFTQVIRPLDIRESAEEKHISFLNGVFNTSEEKKVGGVCKRRGREKNNPKTPPFLTSSNRFFPLSWFCSTSLCQRGKLEEVKPRGCKFEQDLYSKLQTSQEVPPEQQQFGKIGPEQDAVQVSYGAMQSNRFKHTFVALMTTFVLPTQMRKRACQQSI